MTGGLFSSFMEQGGVFPRVRKAAVTQLQARRPPKGWRLEIASDNRRSSAHSVIFALSLDGSLGLPVRERLSRRSWAITSPAICFSALARARSKNYAYQNWKAHLSGALRPDCGLARLWEPQIQEYARTRARVSKVSWEPTGTLTPIDVDARPNRNSRDCSYAVTQLVS